MAHFADYELSRAKFSLPFPIYAADFDPYNRGYLIVGGGGGEGRSGVPNQISVLDLSKRGFISSAVQIELSREEDSVQSLATVASKEGLVILAGVNSSQADQDAGKNEHFRSFSVKYPPRKKQKTEETAQNDEGGPHMLGKRSLFRPPTTPKSETYQRLLRLSPPHKRDFEIKRVGAIATGMAKNSEIVVFDATTSLPESKDIIAQIDLPERSEAADLDIIEANESEFSLAYCDDHDLYEQTFANVFTKKKVEKRPRGPRRIHQMPFPDGLTGTSTRPKFRCLRFLDAENVIALVNRPNKGGAELRIYHIYPTGPAIEAQKHSLPPRILQASGLDVCALDADKDGKRQIVVAVAGQDISIELFTTNFQNSTSTYSAIKPYNTLRKVHGQQMTKLCFTTFHSPAHISSPAETASPPAAPRLPGPQSIKLASVSYGNTVVVDTLALYPLDPSDPATRYVLRHPQDEAFWWWAYVVGFGAVILVTAFLLQAFNVGFADSDKGLFGFLPQDFRDFLDAPAGAALRARGSWSRVLVEDEAAATATTMTATDVPVAEITKASGLRDALTRHHGSPADAQATAVVVRDVPDDDAFDVHVHPDKQTYLAQDEHAKHWHDLEPHQKKYWKAKLIKAGEWTEQEGEGVLKGVLWSTVPGLLADAAGEILREL